MVRSYPGGSITWTMVVTNITGAGLDLDLTTRRWNRHGTIVQAIRPRRKGVLVLRPRPALRLCKVTRVGVASIHPPPVTG